MEICKEQQKYLLLVALTMIQGGKNGNISAYDISDVTRVTRPTSKGTVGKAGKVQEHQQDYLTSRNSFCSKSLSNYLAKEGLKVTFQCLLLDKL